jgi:hypothetical protein
MDAKAIVELCSHQTKPNSRGVHVSISQIIVFAFFSCICVIKIIRIRLLICYKVTKNMMLELVACLQ